MFLLDLKNLRPGNPPPAPREVSRHRELQLKAPEVCGILQGAINPSAQLFSMHARPGVDQRENLSHESSSRVQRSQLGRLYWQPSVPAQVLAHLLKLQHDRKLAFEEAAEKLIPLDLLSEVRCDLLPMRFANFIGESAVQRRNPVEAQLSGQHRRFHPPTRGDVGGRTR